MKKLLLAIICLLALYSKHFAQIDTTVVVYSWMLDESYANRIRTPVDTSLPDFQHHLQPFYSYTGFGSLGNYGQPIQSLVFTERHWNNEFTTLSSYSPFLKMSDHTLYFNTRKPFTQLSYLNSGSSQNKEEMLDAFHTQNLTKTFNIGLHFTTVRSIGQYRFQMARVNTFRFFSSYAAKLYSGYLSLNVNKVIANENGGILNDSLINGTTYTFTKDIPTVFGGTDKPPRQDADVSNRIQNVNFLTIQDIAFRKLNRSNDSIAAPKRIRIFYPKLLYILNSDYSRRLFEDKDPNVGLTGGLYPDVHANNALTRDSLIFWKVHNALRLQFQGKKNNHYFIDYSYDFMKYTLATAVDTAAANDTIWFISEDVKFPKAHYENRFFNSAASSGFSKVFANRLELNLYGKYFLSGYRSGDIVLSGNVKLILGKIERPVSFTASGTNELKTPDFLFTRYVSNNFVWVRNFQKIAQSHLSTILNISSNKFEIRGDYYLFRNFIYLNKEGFPDQYQTALSLVVLRAEKRFDFWKVTSTHRIVYQKCENENILDLPEITYFGSTYLSQVFHFKATGGKLTAMIGFDLAYNSRYYADAYMPPLASFIRQDEKQLGNYPYLDVFLNLQLKRFRFFLKMQHMNSGWIDRDYFSVLHYPRNERDVRFGLTWTFYD